MILEIRLENFFSIKDEVVLNMQAANIQSKRAKALIDNTFECGKGALLKTIAIWGANASGKSSIIKAIRACVRMIFESHNYNEDTVFSFTPFKFGGTGKPSRFYVHFLLDGIEYEYSFAMTKTEILQEELVYYPKGRKVTLFVRDERKGPDKKDIYKFNSIRRPMDVAANTSQKTLFISRASQMDRDIAKEVYRYFNECFILNFFGYNSFSVEKLLDENKEQFLNVLRIADSDIVDIRSRHELKSLTAAVFDPQNNNQLLSRDDIQKPQLVLTTYHRNNPDVPFDFFTEESEGTKYLFYMMLTVLDIVRENKILLIDEIEASLHTKLVEFIIEMFHQSKSAQLIYTTHNTHLLDTKKIRRDQVYFVNKREDGSSDLYSLFDYKDFREEMDLEKAYLQGRFDAVPYIDDLSNLEC